MKYTRIYGQYGHTFIGYRAENGAKINVVEPHTSPCGNRRGRYRVSINMRYVGSFDRLKDAKAYIEEVSKEVE